MILNRCSVYFNIILVLSGSLCINCDEEKRTQLSRSFDDRPLVFATLGGGMVAVEQTTGEILWNLKDEPVVKVPNQDQKVMPQFLPDPQNGFLYMYGSRGKEKNVLKKLPFTIPELVTNSPCRSTDGMLYSGKKMDSWFLIDPKTGIREHVSGFEKEKIFKSDNENTCDIDRSKAIYLARTEYNILMYNSNNYKQKWNVTFFDYRSHNMGKDLLDDYGVIHFASASNGRVVSFNRNTGDFIWSRDFETPVVAAYLLDRNGLITVPFNSIGDNTMDHIMEDANVMTNKNGLKNSNMQLFPTLYIGEHNYGLYALSSLVDKHTITISTEISQSLLIEGPHNEKPMESYKDKHDWEKLEFNDNIHTPFLILGHYKMPELSTWPITTLNTNKGNIELLPILNMDVKLINGKVYEIQGDTENETENTEMSSDAISVAVQTDDNVDYVDWTISLDRLYKYAYIWLHEKENGVLKLTLIILVGLVITMFWYLQYQNREFQQLSQGGSRGSNISNSSRNGHVTAFLQDIGDGEVQIGKITFNMDHILGKGCEGTFVYKGTFDKRAVAVKRLLPECFTFADREVALLRESDAHAHVVRYYCMEQDKQFRYIALELCSATLCDYIEKKLPFECNIDPIELLRQATSGLAHLHSMNIVHRDVKPHNVLLSVPDSKGVIRAMISDFGLCKKLNLGRNSFSRRSGVTGTEGWIAPEMMNGQRTTTSVDIFSLGCVFYYVLSKGKHPFGDVLRRQANILSAEYYLEHLNTSMVEEDVLIAKILIRTMISCEPHLRPVSNVVLANPLFWSKQTKLNFLQDVSDRVEGSNHLVLESNRCPHVLKGDWRFAVCTTVAADLRTRRTYRGDKVTDLLRALRNKKHHYRELNPEVQESLGSIPDGFVTYWLSRFPHLLAYVWLIMQHFRNEDIIRQYYRDDFVYNIEDVPELIENYQNQELESKKIEVNPLFNKSKSLVDETYKPKARYKWNKSPKKRTINGHVNFGRDKISEEGDGHIIRKKQSNSLGWKMPE